MTRLSGTLGVLSEDPNIWQLISTHNSSPSALMPSDGAYPHAEYCAGQLARVIWGEGTSVKKMSPSD